ncbi:MAG: peptidoglycan DD-metalloendopeptidase family protein [Crocinitomicaceae bacterium]|nr:peptidoglycan DD-metalloendopeptidase family protein [Crocinitomicaceae bacterium]
MKDVSKVVCIFLLLCYNVAWGQSTSDKLKKEEARLERKIADTKLLLDQSKTNTASSLNELRVIENQIAYREQLLKNYDNQIRGAEMKIQDKQQQIELLHLKIDRLKAQYKKLLVYAYKHRNKYGKMMYLFSADNYNVALKRKKYLEHISEIQQKQFLAIRQNQAIIEEEIIAIEEEKAYKSAIIAEKSKEKIAIEEDRMLQAEVYKQFKQEEEVLYAKLKEDEQKRAVLSQKIAAAIQKEIAEAEERRRKAEEARRLAAAANNTNVETTPSGPTFEETREEALLSASFEGNKGKLPWPVKKGSITEGFGKNLHPTLKNVYTNNRGIDISAPRNAQVRAVFDGEVTSVLNIPGAGKVVIIKHGNYRTVYSNLQDTYVTSGQRVTTKKVIGSLLSGDQQNMSVAHFEIHKVSNGTVTCLNPTLWVSH